MLELEAWVSENSTPIAIFTSGVFILLLLFLSMTMLPWRAAYNWVRGAVGKYNYPYKLYKTWRRKRDRDMAMRREMERWLCDVLCHHLEDAVYVGMFTRSQVDKVYIDCATKMGLRDLMPRNVRNTRQDQKILKAKIMERIGPEAKAKVRAARGKKVVKLKDIRARFRRTIRRAVNAA